MLFYDSGAIMRAASTIKQLEMVIKVIPETEKFNKNDIVSKGDKENIMQQLKILKSEIGMLDTKITQGLIEDLTKHLSGRTKLNYNDCKEWLTIISSVVRRELSAMQTFCIDRKHIGFFEVNYEDIEQNFEVNFPTALYEFDEAGKCLALSRSTASVFHLLRAMEVGIRAVARCLSIPDPIKDAERNWGKVLEKIRSETDRRNKSNEWSGQDRDLFQSLHASLDAVRVSWRNTTMHVDNKYTPDEAEHIFIAVKGFMRKLASRCDEQGLPVA